METIDTIASIIKEATGYDATAHNFPKGNSGWAITLTTTIWDDEIILDVYQCEFRPTICGEETADVAKRAAYQARQAIDNSRAEIGMTEASDIQYESESRITTAIFTVTTKGGI